MWRLVLSMLAVSLFGLGAAVAQELPEGTFVSLAEGCAKLRTHTPAELGEGLDFYVLNQSGIAAYRQTCEFVTVAPRAKARWLVAAFCDEEGYVYPDLFAIAQGDDGSLVVTRLTDFTLQNGTQTEEMSAFTEDMNPVELGRETEVAGAPETGGADSAAGARPDGYNTYVLCPDAKP